MGGLRPPGRRAPDRALRVGQDQEAMASFLHRAGARHPARARCARRCRSLEPVVALQMRHQATSTARACLAALPGQLDRVDALLAEGVIGGERPNAADFQIAPSVRLMLNFDQLRPHIEARPAGAHARRSCRIIQAGSGKCSRHSGFRSETVTLADAIAAWLWHPEGATGARRARPRPLGRPRPAPARLRRALRRGRPGRAAVRLPPLRRQRRRAAPALRHRSPARGLAHRDRPRARPAGDRARRPVRLLLRRRARDHARGESPRSPRSSRSAR